MFLRVFFLSFFGSVGLLALDIDHSSASVMASHSYLDPKEFAKKYPNTTLSTAVSMGVRYYILEDSQNTTIVIRGTDNIRNMITDVMAKERAFLGDEAVLVHGGFYDVAMKIFQTIKLDTKKEVVLVGHSLGGAVSLLYGAMLFERGVDVSIYSFGMPPVVNRAFLKRYRDLVHYRHYHIFDPIPSLSKPTIELFEVQKKFKAFVEQKETIATMIDTLKTIPEKYRHHGITNTIKKDLDIPKERLEKSLFFQTCTIYFDYHKIENYLKALMGLEKQYLKVVKENLLYEPKNQPKKKRYIKVIPSTLKGTVPLEVEFYIDSYGVDISMYYFNFNGKEILLEELANNKIGHTFRKAGKNSVKIALKDSKNNMVETSLVVETREATFAEYQEAFGKEFSEFLQKNSSKR